uniref:Uncharacterized protein n=1 Tax=Hyaloperonospora arabidopsidis (strain Emoy2) TaxID=559515 RepID=M4B795_HYAAE
MLPAQILHEAARKEQCSERLTFSILRRLVSRLRVCTVEVDDKSQANQNTFDELGFAGFRLFGSHKVRAIYSLPSA